MAEFGAIYLTSLAILLGCMVVLWLISVWLRGASVVYPFRGMAVVISAFSPRPPWD